MSKDLMMYRFYLDRALTEMDLYYQMHYGRDEIPPRSLRNIMAYVGRYSTRRPVNENQLRWSLERAKSELGFDYMPDKIWARVILTAISSFSWGTNPQTRCTWREYLAITATGTGYVSTKTEIQEGVPVWIMRCDCD